MGKARIKHIFPFMNLPDLILFSRNPEGIDYNASFMSLSLLGTHLCLVCHFVFKTVLNNMRLSGNKTVIVFFGARKSRK